MALFWKTQLEEQIFWISLDRPAKGNAFSNKVGDELLQILENIENDDEIRVIVIGTTSDDVFCAGADIQWFTQLKQTNGQQASINTQKVFQKLEFMHVPVIAAVKGLNLTAGLELSMACDLIIAAENARFGQIETKYGLTPGGGGTQRLVRLVGPLKAKELIYTAKIIDAQEALEIGLVNHVVPLDELDDFVKILALQIIRNSPRAVRKAKELIQMGMYTNEQGFAMENLAFGEHFGFEDSSQRFRLFLRKLNEKEKQEQKKTLEILKNQ